MLKKNPPRGPDATELDYPDSAFTVGNGVYLPRLNGDLAKVSFSVPFVQAGKHPATTGVRLAFSAPPNPADVALADAAIAAHDGALPTVVPSFGVPLPSISVFLPEHSKPFSTKPVQVLFGKVLTPYDTTYFDLLSDGSVLLKFAGIVSISFHVGMTNIKSRSRTTAMARIAVLEPGPLDYIPGSTGYSYHRMEKYGYDTASVSNVIYPVAKDSVIAVHTQRVSGASFLQHEGRAALLTVEYREIDDG